MNNDAYIDRISKQIEELTNMKNHLALINNQKDKQIVEDTKVPSTNYLSQCSSKNDFDDEIEAILRSGAKISDQKLADNKMIEEKQDSSFDQMYNLMFSDDIQNIDDDLFRGKGPGDSSEKDIFGFLDKKNTQEQKDAEYAQQLQEKFNTQDQQTQQPFINNKNDFSRDLFCGDGSGDKDFEAYVFEDKFATKNNIQPKKGNNIWF